MKSDSLMTNGLNKKKVLSLSDSVTVSIPSNPDQFISMNDQLRRPTGITLFTTANQANNVSPENLSSRSQSIIPIPHLHNHQIIGLDNVTTSIIPQTHTVTVVTSSSSQPIVNNIQMPVKIISDKQIHQQQQQPQQQLQSNKTIGRQLECGKWKCLYCPSTYKHKPHLARHMITHTGDKPYSCNYCNKRYFRKDNYEIHLKSHSEDKPFICTYCHKEFLRKNNFERHVRLHTGEKPYACPYCLHRSIRKDTLEGHIYRNHTRDLQSIDKDDDLSSSSDEDNQS